jgi:hypothetical protein
MIDLNDSATLQGQPFTISVWLIFGKMFLGLVIGSLCAAIVMIGAILGVAIGFIALPAQLFFGRQDKFFSRISQS